MPATAIDRRAARAGMVGTQLEARGIRQPALLEAVRVVPREAFVPAELEEFAYEDAPLPIAAGQTISQPYIVGLMLDGLELEPDDTLLEVGSGSGYAAAVASRLCRRVIGIERHAELAARSREALERLGYDNVEIRHGDGTRGAPDEAPFDAILVSAGGPRVPPSLSAQLAVGGRLVIPIGERGWLQRLVRVRRVSAERDETEDMGPVAFVPLVGVEAWPAEEGEEAAEPRGQGSVSRPRPAPPAPPPTVPEQIARYAEPVTSLAGVSLDGLLARIGESRLVLLGEASHGTSEFYRMRARITRELIEQRGFVAVAVEADWPDAARIDRWVHGAGDERHPEQAFARFPTWMWRNVEVLEFVDWLRRHNQSGDPGRRQVGFYGLDLYSLYGSIAEVLRYLDRSDPEAARIARERYGCLTPYQSDPAVYGMVALTDPYRSCEDEVVAMLRELLGRRGEATLADGRRLLDVERNARVAAAAEHYYRAMYQGGADSWNLRDRHMFETLEAVLAFHGPDARVVVWAHNSHLGDASATAMASRGELNLGQLVREAYGPAAYLVGFGTDRGTVAAATNWGGQMEIKRVRPSHADSYERLCHDSGLPGFLLPDGEQAEPRLREGLSRPRLERAIGVIYRPETELLSHYFEARLPAQFDEWIWFDETSAIRPLSGAERAPELAEGHPFSTLDI